MSADKQATLDALEAERLARKMGVSPEVAQWLGWLWRPDIHLRSPTVTAEEPASPDCRAGATIGLTPGRRERSAQPAWSPEARMPREPTEWLKFCVTVRDPGDGDSGEVAEAEWGVSDDGELVVRDLDGAVLARQRLEAGADPRRVARALLRGRSPRKGNVIQFPNVGVA